MPEFVADYVTESVFSLKLSQSLFFVKFQSFIMNGYNRFCDRVCF